MAGESRIRLVAMDIDGTLLDDDKEVPPVNLRALRAAMDEGVHVAIASGRMVPSIEGVERKLGLDCALIAYNGGKVVGPSSEGRPVIAHRPVSAGAAQAVLDFCLEKGHLLNLYFDDVLYADHSQEKSPLAALYNRRTGSVYHFTDLRRFSGSRPTKMILLAEPAERERLHAEFSARMKGQVNVLRSDPEYLEFMDIEVDKATALPALAGYYGLGVDQVMAIGDADNDRRMIEEAGVGVAVANATEPVLRAATHTTRRNNNEGAVAEALERWVLENAVKLWDDGPE